MKTPALKLGDKFNKLTVLGFDFERHLYKCKCECGTLTFAASCRLKNNTHTQCKSCGNKQSGKTKTGKCPSIIDGKKKCKKCGNNFPIENFKISYFSSKGTPILKAYCRPCETENCAAWRLTFSEEKKKEINKRNRERYTTEEYRELYLKRKYDLCFDDILKMIKDQNNKCYICKRVLSSYESKRKKDSPCIDHDHKTGKIRKILCHPCNVILGLANENKDLFSKFPLYLIEHEK